MKVALMLTGLARKVEDGYNHYWKHIIENHDVDLYLHAWESKPDEITNNEDSDEVRRIYKNPKYFKLEAPFKFTKYREGIDNPNDPDSRPLVDFDVLGNFRSFPMYYGWESTYSHIKNSNIKYDCVIRSRYDISGTPINLEHLDMNKINTAYNHWPRTKIHDDNLCISSLENSNNIFSNIFKEIHTHHKNEGHVSFAESMFTSYLERKGISSSAHKAKPIVFQLLRDKKIWF
jgi:hypothetical protein